MSWFTDLAGKAEDFLVKIDENAAVAAQVINKEKSSSKLRSSTPVMPPNLNDKGNPPTISSVPPSPSSSGKTLKLDRDSTLMASLNLNNSTNNDSNTYSGVETSTDFTVRRENELLKQEVKSLNQEMRKSVQNGRQLEKGDLVILISGNFHEFTLLTFVRLQNCSSAAYRTNGSSKIFGRPISSN